MPPRPSPEADRIPELLIRALEQRGFGVADGPWQALSGGRTNRCWRVRLGGEIVVVKLFGRGGEANPLFPNDPSAEAAVLAYLHGQGLAPEMLDHVATGAGDCIVYRHVEGAVWRSGTADVARLMAGVHDRDGLATLRRAPDGSRALAAQTLGILRHCPADRADRLRRMQPRGRVAASGRARLLHGDPVPGNIIATGPRMRLIDWQCPAIGDPCEDIALFLSPAMQITYRGARLSAAERAGFLDSYPVSEIVDRYRLLAPWYHWRMAAYCTWLAGRGDALAIAAADAEIAALTGECA